MNGQISIFDVLNEITHNSEEVGKCETCLYKKKVSGYGKTIDMEFPCLTSECMAHGMKEPKVTYNCEYWKANSQYFDVCGSCINKNSCVNGFCMLDNKPNYRAVFEYVAHPKDLERNPFEYKYSFYTCDKYFPHPRERRRNDTQTDSTH